MRTTVLFTITGEIFFLFGLLLLLSPQSYAWLYGATLAGFAGSVTRLWGGATLGLALACLLAREWPENPAKLALALTVAVVNAAQGVIYLVYVLNGLLNTLGWINVAFHAGLALAFGTVYLLGPTETTTT